MGSVGRRRRGDRGTTRGNDELLHLTLHAVQRLVDQATFEGDDRIFVLKQHADARPVILLAPALVSVFNYSAREKPLHVTNIFAALVGVPGL